MKIFVVYSNTQFYGAFDNSKDCIICMQKARKKLGFDGYMDTRVNMDEVELNQLPKYLENIKL